LRASYLDVDDDDDDDDNDDDDDDDVGDVRRDQGDNEGGQ